MRPTSLLTVVIAFGALAGLTPCQAQIFRCPNGDAVIFQQGPCDGLQAGGGRLIRTADGQTVRPPEVIAPAPASPPPSPTAAAMPAGRVYGRTPLPTSKALRTAKSP